MGFQSVHVFTAKRTCSVVGTGGISHRNFSMVADSCQPWCLKGVSGPWRKANLLSSPRWVRATGEMVVLLCSVCPWNPTRESGTATSTATTSSSANLVPFYGYNPHGVPASDQQLLPHGAPSSLSNPYNVPTYSHQPLPHNVPSGSSNQAPFYEYNPHGISASSQQPIPHNVPSSSSTDEPPHQIR